MINILVYVLLLLLLFSITFQLSIGSMHRFYSADEIIPDCSRAKLKKLLASFFEAQKNG